MAQAVHPVGQACPKSVALHPASLRSVQDYANTLTVQVVEHGLLLDSQEQRGRTNLQDYRALNASPQLVSRQWRGRLLLSVLVLIF